MAQWKVVGVEMFKGEEYIKMERLDLAQASPFAKKQANISRPQMKALLEHFEPGELFNFAGLPVGTK